MPRPPWPARGRARWGPGGAAGRAAAGWVRDAAGEWRSSPARPARRAPPTGWESRRSLALTTGWAWRRRPERRRPRGPAAATRPPKQVGPSADGTPGAAAVPARDFLMALPRRHPAAAGRRAGGRPYTAAGAWTRPHPVATPRVATLTHEDRCAFEK